MIKSAVGAFLPIAELNQLLPAFSKSRLTAMHLCECFFFLGVAGAICLAPFSRTFSSDFFPQWLMPFPFASAASYRWETANCSLCKVRRVFVIQLEVLHIWMWGETAAIWGLYLHIVWRWAQLCVPELSTGPLWAKSKPCSYIWHEMER